MENKQITVTSPLLPDLEDFNLMLKEIWSSKWITNNGSFHRQLEAALCEYLKVPYISLFTNGTLPLITALQALNMFGCMRLASRISDLRSEGFPIAKEMIEVNGKRVAQYWLQRAK